MEIDMKKRRLILNLLVAIALCAVMFLLCACGRGDNKTKTVYGYELSAGGDYYVISVKEAHEADITLPAEHEGIPVKEIASFAFSGQSKIKSITLPEGITAVSDYAFSGCPSLESVNISSTVTDIGIGAFSGCPKLSSLSVSEGNSVFGSAGNCIIRTQDKSVAFGISASIIPSDAGLKSIADHAFFGISGIKCLTIPSGVESIGKFAFAGCTELTCITVMPGLTDIGENAFSDCGELTLFAHGSENEYVYSDVLSRDGFDGETVFGFKEFFDDGNAVYALTEGGEAYLFEASDTEVAFFELPDTVSGAAVSKIMRYAFSGCTNLKSIELTDSVRLASDAFDGCPIENATVSIQQLSSIPKDALKKLTLTGGAFIGRGTLAGCEGLKSLVISDKITEITYDSVFSFTALDSIVVEEGNPAYYSIDNCLIEKSSGALRLGCKNSLIPSDGSVTEIGMYAFAGSQNLTTLHVPSTVTEINGTAFIGCTALESITADEGNAVYHAKDNCLIDTESGRLILGCKTSVIPSDGSVTDIGAYAFRGRRGLKSIFIPKSIKNIIAGAFTDCPDIESITVESGSSYISAGNCLIDTRTKTLVLGCGASEIPTDGSVEKIGMWAFAGCTELYEITLPESVTEVSEYAFQNCTELVRAILPEGVERLTKFSFEGCEKLTVYSFAKSDPWRGSITGGDNRFIFNFKELVTVGDLVYAILGDGTARLTEYHGKAEKVTVEAAVGGYKVTAISKFVFRDNAYICEVLLPNTLKVIGRSAFENCTALSDINLGYCPELSEIGDSAFLGCASLSAVTVPESVEKISEDAFKNCNRLKIYSRLASAPKGWDEDWNSSLLPVFFGYSE